MEFPVTTARTCLQLLGHMAACTYVVRHARRRMRPLQLWLASEFSQARDGMDKVLTVPGRVLTSLQWWTVPANVLQGIPFREPPPLLDLVSDASDLGWGAHVGNSQTQGLWLAAELSLHINVNKLRAVRLAYVAFSSRLSGRTARADRLSRVFSSQHKWSLHSEVMGQLFRAWGTPQVDLFATRQNRRCHRFCSGEGAREGCTLGCLLPVMVGPAPLCIPSLSPHRQGPGKEGQGLRPPDRPSLGQTALVRDPPRVTGGASTACPTGSLVPRPGLPPSPQPSLPSLDSVAAQWLDAEETMCSEGVRSILLENQKPSTRRAYLIKWARFSRWAGERGTSPRGAPLQAILEYLLHLRTQGLAPSSVRVHPARRSTRRSRAARSSCMP
ncbi:uncharacterized protein RBU57_001734 [Macrochelys suwanniensis]